MVYYTKNGGTAIHVKEIEFFSGQGEKDSYYMNPHSLHNMTEYPVFVNHLKMNVEAASIVETSIMKVDENKNIFRGRITIHNHGDIGQKGPKTDPETSSFTNYMVYSADDRIRIRIDDKESEIAFAGTEDVTAQRLSFELNTRERVEEDIYLGKSMCACAVINEKDSSDLNDAGRAKLVDIVFVFTQKDLKAMKDVLKMLTESLTGKPIEKRTVNR